MARIYLDIEICSIKQKIEVETDNEIKCDDFKEQIISQMQMLNYDVKFNKNLTFVYDPISQKQLNDDLSLKNNGIYSGQRLLII